MLETCTRLQYKRSRQHHGDGRLEVAACPIGLWIITIAVERQQRGTVPLLVVLVELETEVHTVGSDVVFS